MNPLECASRWMLFGLLFLGLAVIAGVYILQAEREEAKAACLASYNSRLYLGIHKVGDKYYCIMYNGKRMLYLPPRLSKRH